MKQLIKSTRRFTIPTVVAFLLGAAVAAALAAEHTIHQKGKVFSAPEITIKKGDTLVFLNDDNITHNVLSTTPGNDFNLGAIGPGRSTPVTFTKASTVDIICAIHPGMKMQVKVTE
jgi:plastocyanin